MSADNRTVATDALATLGTIIGEGEKRDAIHLAVEPAVAGHPLNPGQDVGIHDGKAYAAGVLGIKTVGIVDPFLRSMVDSGQRFWLVVYPRQITSLRHVWTHPDFPEAEVSPVPVICPVPDDGPDIASELAAARKTIRELEEQVADFECGC